MRNIVEGKYGASSVKVRAELGQPRKFMYNHNISFIILFYVYLQGIRVLSAQRVHVGAVYLVCYRFLCAITEEKHENLNRK